MKPPPIAFAWGSAFLSPLLYSVVNIVDKLAISQKVLNTSSYLILVVRLFFAF